MVSRLYVGQAVFRFRLQSGSWPACDDAGTGVLDPVKQTLLSALMRDGLDFTYRDGAGNVSASVQSVHTVVPCGQMGQVADVSGSLAWTSSRSPKPDQVWTLGEGLAKWLTAVPWVTEDFTAMIGLTSLYLPDTGSTPGGALWPEPGTEETSIE